MSTFHDAKPYVIVVMLYVTSNIYDLLRSTCETFMIYNHSHLVMLRYVNVLLCYFVAASSYQRHLKI